MSAATAVDEVRAALARHGVLFAHDPVLPSVTTLVAGVPIAGSWWGHSAGHAIFRVLSDLEDEVAWPKLVDGKVTLVHHSLWPALAAIGEARQAWQTRGVSAALLAAADRVAEDSELEAGELDLSSRDVTLLERRLLVLGRQKHTGSGRHERVLASWSRLAPEAPRPDPDDAMKRFEKAIAPWKGGRLPWTLRA
jgi:hypothetical protein